MDLPKLDAVQMRLEFLQTNEILSSKRRYQTKNMDNTDAGKRTRLPSKNRFYSLLTRDNYAKIRAKIFI